MSDRNTEDIIGALYDMVQDARSMPLAADKCILERDRVLDMLDEIIAQLPSELKQSRTIVESRNELISQARREAEMIMRHRVMVCRAPCSNRAKSRQKLFMEEKHQLMVIPNVIALLTLSSLVAFVAKNR